MGNWELRIGEAGDGDMGRFFLPQRCWGFYLPLRARRCREYFEKIDLIDWIGGLALRCIQCYKIQAALRAVQLLRSVQKRSPVTYWNPHSWDWRSNEVRSLNAAQQRLKAAKRLLNPWTH